MKLRQDLKVSLGVLALTGVLLAGLYLRPAQAINAGDVLKIGGVLLAVNQLGDNANHGINILLRQRKAEAMGATKVVPIVSVGQGTYLGAAQVVGVPSLVRRVQAVATVETTFGRADGTLLIPISTQMPGSKLSRVSGVGVGAILDLKL